MRATSSFLLSIFVFFSITTSQPAAASGDAEPCNDYDCTSFFIPEIIDSPAESPFFLSVYTYYKNKMAAETSDPIQEANLAEWDTYLAKKLPKERLSLLLYKSSSQDLSNLAAYWDGKPAALSKEFDDIKKALEDPAIKAKTKGALRYLLLAKKVEPIVTRRSQYDSWDSENVSSHKVDDAKTATEVIQKTGEALKEEKDQFLLERYHLQAIRTLFYAGKFQEAQKYFEANKDQFKSENSPKYRFMDLAAGSLYREKKYGKANYLYSKIFNNFPPLKAAAYLCFHPQEEADWKESYSLAVNDQERAVLWQLLGIRSDGLTAMKKIYDLNQKSNLLSLLLVREVGKAEKEWVSQNAEGAAEGKVDDKTAPVTARIALVKSIVDAGKVEKLWIWQLSLAHLYVLANQILAAEKYLALASAMVPDRPQAQAQLRMTKLFAKVMSMKAVQIASEDYLAKELSWLHHYNDMESKDRADSLNKWALAKLSELYLKNKDLTRSILLKDSPGNEIYRSNNRVDELRAFLSKKEKSNFDKTLAEIYPYNEEDLNEIKGINSFYAADVKKAEEFFEVSGKSAKEEKLWADPFEIHIKDCHDCDQGKEHAEFTKLSLAKKMVALSEAAKGKGAPAAQANFDLANGFYNVSVYGNSRNFYVTKNSNSGWNNEGIMAEKYYKLAAELSTDREFQAKATFMASKVEQNTFFKTNGIVGYAVASNDPKHTDFKAGVYFKKLKDKFSDTKYYQETIKECGYFNTFVDSKKMEAEFGYKTGPRCANL